MESVQKVTLSILMLSASHVYLDAQSVLSRVNAMCAWTEPIEMMKVSVKGVPSTVKHVMKMQNVSHTSQELVYSKAKL